MTTKDIANAADGGTRCQAGPGGYPNGWNGES
jgi:hypothetical protein